MDQSTEEMIQARGLTAPRVHPEDLQAEIVKAEYHRFENTTVTVCCLYLRNGFTVVGHSACADASNFDPEIGRKIARDHATEQLWPLLGFRLRDQLDAAAKSIPVEVTRDPEIVPVPGEGPSKPVELGDQVLFYEQVDGQVSVPMLALVTDVVDHNRVSLTVFAPNGSAHSRQFVEMVYPWSPAPAQATAQHFCRPK